MAGGTLLRGRAAERTRIGRLAAAALAAMMLAAACDSDPVRHGEGVDGEDSAGGPSAATVATPFTCDTSVAGDPYVTGANCRTVDVDGYPREYIVYVPPAYVFTDTTPAPVVFMFHGGSGNGLRFYNISLWKQMADSVGLIAVFPTGLEYLILANGQWSTRWHEYTLPGEVDLTQKPAGYPATAPWPADDVGFVRAMMDDLESQIAVDTTRIYASGFSNGGTFTSRLAVEAADRIAAFAYVGGGFCQQVVPNWSMHPPRAAFMAIGSIDPKLLDKIADAGGPVLSEFPFDADSILDVGPLFDCLEYQLAAFELDTVPTGGIRALANFTHMRWDSTLVAGRTNTFQFAVLDDVEHEYPNGANNPHNFAAAVRFWTFFRRHPLN